LSADVVNLRQARKIKARVAHEQEAAANRLRFGESRLAKDEAAQARRQLGRHLDLHRLGGGESNDEPS
jgi:hypothetical protein